MKSAFNFEWWLILEPWKGFCAILSNNDPFIARKLWLWPKQMGQVDQLVQSTILKKRKYLEMEFHAIEMCLKVFFKYWWEYTRFPKLFSLKVSKDRVRLIQVCLDWLWNGQGDTYRVRKRKRERERREKKRWGRKKTKSSDSEIID